VVPNCRVGSEYGDNPGLIEDGSIPGIPARACYHVNRGNIFGSCLILVGVLTLFLLALGMTRMKLTPMIGTTRTHTHTHARARARAHTGRWEEGALGPCRSLSVYLIGCQHWGSHLRCFACQALVI